jgi:hypothetical protein
MRKHTQAVFASILRNPNDARVLAAIGCIHLTFAYYGIKGWTCPILFTTGVPCPGCGLTRAAGALLEGDWKTMATTHLFAPVYIAAAVLIGIIAIVPEKLRNIIVEKIAQVENQTRLTLVVVFGLVLYWGLRLVLDPGSFIDLMKSIN